jgi:lipopolysaccharide biosynthesis glycosyltransferase
MYNIKFEKDKYICGVLEGINLKKEVENLGIQTDKYINAGILLINGFKNNERKINRKEIARFYCNTCFKVL